MLTITRQFKLCPCIKLFPQRCITKSTKIKKSHNNHKHACLQTLLKVKYCGRLKIVCHCTNNIHIRNVHILDL